MTETEHEIETCTIHHTDAGIEIQTISGTRYLIDEKDVDLLRRGVIRPVRDDDGQLLGLRYYAVPTRRELIISLGTVKITVPGSVWKARDATRHVVAQPVKGVTA